MCCCCVLLCCYANNKDGVLLACCLDFLFRSKTKFARTIYISPRSVEGIDTKDVSVKYWKPLRYVVKKKARALELIKERNHD